MGFDIRTHMCICLLSIFLFGILHTTIPKQTNIYIYIVTLNKGEPCFEDVVSMIFAWTYASYLQVLSTLPSYFSVWLGCDNKAALNPIQSLLNQIEQIESNFLILFAGDIFAWRESPSPCSFQNLQVVSAFQELMASSLTALPDAWLKSLRNALEIGLYPLIMSK